MAEEFNPTVSAPQGSPAPQPSTPPAPPSGGTGLAPNLAGALCYLLGLITGIVFLMLEKENRFVRFHAMQSIIFSIVVFVVNIVLGFVPGFGGLISTLVSLGGAALWVVLMVKAYQGEEWELPVLGKIAREQVGKMA